jgi:uncharacterized membrane protein
MLLKELIPIGLLVLATIVGFSHYQALPDQIPVHFDRKGNPDNWMPKLYALFMVPVITVVVYILLSIWTYFMPSMFWWKALMIFFLCNLHIATIYYALERVRSVFTPMVPSVVLLIIYLIYLFGSMRN